MSKISVCELFLQCEDSDDMTFSCVYAFGSSFQGALMEIVGAQTAAELHENQGNSVNQYVQNVTRSEQNQLVWRVVVFSNEYKEKVIDRLMNSELTQVHLKSNEQTYKIKKKTIEQIEMSELGQIFNGRSDVDNYRHKLNFLTPTSFKHNGNYQMMPTSKLIVQSLAMKYGMLFDNEKDVDEELLETVEQWIHITSFNIRSFYMNVKGAKIPAFVGNLTLTVNGTETLKNYIAMLVKFAEYCSVGIKTSMGMGKVKVG
jgi:CRISPR-associated endoribonuclease Cas6